jgi:DNA-binding MarR family transcriptional regulator
MSTTIPPGPSRTRPGYLLKRVQHALRNRMDSALRPIGLTTPQYAVLTAVRADPGISNATLAREAFVTAQTMQAIVTNLERDGFILRHADPSHGRILRTGLTDHGHEALIRADRVVFDVESAMIRSLSEGEVATLINLLGRCGENLSSDE